MVFIKLNFHFHFLSSNLTQKLTREDRYHYILIDHFTFSGLTIVRLFNFLSKLCSTYINKSFVLNVFVATLYRNPGNS